MQVHGREEGDVEEHDAEDDQGEGEGDVESIWKVDREKVLLAAVDHGRIRTEKFPGDPGRVGNDEEGVSEPCEREWRAGEQVDCIHGVSDNLSDCPCKEKKGETNRVLRWRTEVEYCPSDIYSTEYLLERHHHRRSDQANSCMEDLEYCSRLKDLKSEAGMGI